MSQPLPPCTPDCPKRSWVCHDRKVCPDWGKYQDEMAAWKQMLQAARREQEDFDSCVKRRES